MTKDIQRAILRACSQFILRKLEPLEKRLSDMETKAMTVEYDGVVKELLSSDGLATLVDLQVTEAVEKRIRDGKDGAPGERGEKGDTGPAGEDGVGLAGAMIDRDGNLQVTKTNGEAIPLGPVIGKDGRDGRDGADGLGFDDLDVEYDGERTFTFKWQRGSVVKTKSFHVPTVIDRGYWREGTKAEAGDAMTHDGTLWIATKATSDKPCRESDAWRIGARKGRDGLQGPPGKAYEPTQPVKLSEAK